MPNLLHFVIPATHYNSFLSPIATTVTQQMPDFFHTFQELANKLEPKTWDLGHQSQDSNPRNLDVESRREDPVSRTQTQGLKLWPRFRFYIKHCIKKSSKKDLCHVEVFIIRRYILTEWVWNETALNGINTRISHSFRSSQLRSHTKHLLIWEIFCLFIFCGI